MTHPEFQQRLLEWFKLYGRKNLPWQKNITPYRVWISETMLQQTQVSTVIPYYDRFVERFPNVESLAASAIDEVLQHWSGLGYYARARNLHKAALLIDQQGIFPDSFDELIKLPGVGRSTAGAILSIAFNRSHPILDGNVKRVLARYRAINGWPGEANVNQQLWQLSTELTPNDRVADYTQAIMDLGATLCSRHQPACLLCPLQEDCMARKTGRVADFPNRKPVKLLPVKQLVFLVLRDKQNRILLAKRPPTGIWGGLWSLPEFEHVDSAISWCAENDINISTQETLKSGRHNFSHYHLDYLPLHVKTDDVIHKVMEGERLLWYDTNKNQNIGLPAPIKQFLTP
jgi:A/G-specific adenine glycosylase